MKILSCVPKQQKLKEDKFRFIQDALEKYSPDIFLLPQEFFGGWQCEQISFKRDQILPRLLTLSASFNCALIVGVVEQAEEILQKLYFIDGGQFIGEIVKFATPGYDLKGTGTHGLSSLTDLTSRFQTFRIKGINVAGFFCWEVFSDFLIAGLSILEPDLVVSAIKFGIAGYPKLEKKNGLKQIVGVQYCGGDIWDDRLKMASKYEFKCPIICSTNSWGVGGKYEPLAGMIYSYDQIEAVKADAVKQDVFVLNEIDFEHVRGLRENKYSYVDRVGIFPDYKYGDLTMMMKIHRMEQRLLGETLQDGYLKTLRKIRRSRKMINKK